jgi:hypothetical protein
MYVYIDWMGTSVQLQQRIVYLQGKEQKENI